MTNRHGLGIASSLGPEVSHADALADCLMSGATSVGHAHLCANESSGRSCFARKGRFAETLTFHPGYYLSNDFELVAMKRPAPLDSSRWRNPTFVCLARDITESCT